MDNKYIDFDQAVEFLKTTRSTLYKWLREGRVPAHKLGRQWRFVVSELSVFLSGSGGAAPEALRHLSQFLVERHGQHHGKEASMKKVSESSSPAPVAEQLLWDAVDHQATDVHLQPREDGVAVFYRVQGALRPVTTLPAAAAAALDAEFRQRSQPLKSEHSRRFFLGRELEAGRQEIQLGYQALQVLDGRHVSLKIHHADRLLVPLDKISRDTKVVNTLRRWCARPYGLVLIAGAPVSGKTTTFYSAMQECIARRGGAVFTIEDPVHVRIPGANQVEADLGNAQHYKEVFEGVMQSDLDCLFVGSSVTTEHLPLIYRTALEAAKTGHLVFVHLAADGVDDAVARVNRHLDEKIDAYLVGVSWQQFVKDAKGARAVEYELRSGKLDK